MKTNVPYLGVMVAMSAVLAGCGGSNHNGGVAGTDPTYTISGTVSGLAGSGLVLSNGGVSLGIGSDGNFSFADPLAAGASYDVTVATQPSSPAQVCTVANGSGVANANVTNVAVTCTTTTYTLSGTVSGLTGTGLVLTNGGANLPVAADGNFTFADPVNAGTTYDVTVSTQPSLPTQACTVANGSGTASANIGNVAVTCATTPMSIISSTPANAAVNVARTVVPAVTFSAALDNATVAGHVTFKRGTHTVPATLTSSADTVTVTPQGALSLLTTYKVAADTGLLGLYGEPTMANTEVAFTTVDGVWHGKEAIKTNAPNTSNVVVAVMPNGNAVATWYEYDGPHAKVWANIYTLGTGWGTGQQLQTTNTSDETNPRIAVDAHGHAVVVWVENNGVRYDVFYNRYTTGTGWGTATLLGASNQGLGNESPTVAMNANGDAVFAWVNHTNGDYAVWAQVMAANGAMGPAARIESAVGNTGDMRAVMDPAGNATVVWQNADAGNNTVDLWSNTYSGGSWGTDSVVETTTDAVSEYSTPVSSSGAVYAAWTQQLTNTSQGVYISRYDAGAGWSAATLLATTTDSAAYYPRAAAAADGDLLVVWGQYDGSVLNEYSRYQPAGGAWAAPVVTGMNTTTQVEFDGSGNAMGVWIDRITPSNQVIKASRFTAAGGWATPVVLSPGSTVYAEGSSFGIDALGGAMAVWIEYDSLGNTSNVLGSRFDDSPLNQ